MGLATYVEACAGIIIGLTALLTIIKIFYFMLKSDHGRLGANFEENRLFLGRGLSLALEFEVGPIFCERP